MRVSPGFEHCLKKELQQGSRIVKKNNRVSNCSQGSSCSSRVRARDSNSTVVGPEGDLDLEEGFELLDLEEIS